MDMLTYQPVDYTKKKNRHFPHRSLFCFVILHALHVFHGEKKETRARRGADGFFMCGGGGRGDLREGGGVGPNEIGRGGGNARAIRRSRNRTADD